MVALVQDALDLRVDFQVIEINKVLTIGKHLNEELRIHPKHLTFYLQVVVKRVVSLLPKLDLLQVDLYAHITHVQVLESDILIQVVCGPVSKVSEGVEDFFCPVLEEGFKVNEVLAQVRHELLHLPSLLDLKEVLVMLGV
eukprot:CAMPEP_0170566474 /NCGR_PEP_ID=MMETSP0211-20121228/79861_1 /TAXON_ID=311385 /ORGANISM="Pseudokeronopsis sp., Strain OXSARD2" /LENGTH=139 /DNA_ID=CAMNT_0010887657 /DNA_START=453 /DNA_END=872 /DNA_ORIENTATION=-